jgi:hypothetical protein
MRQVMRLLIAGIVAGFAATLASGGIIGIVGGTAAPPSSLGPFTLREFALDTRPIFSEVMDVPSPLGGLVGFDEPMTHTRAGLIGWSSWSHGYAGDVYFTTNHPPGLSRTLDLTQAMDPELGGVAAFRLSIAPHVSDLVSFTLVATSLDGEVAQVHVVVEQFSQGRWLGFYTTDDDVITSVRVETLRAFGTFGIAEFAIAAIPEPGTLVLLLTFLTFAGVGSPRSAR